MSGLGQANIRNLPAMVAAGMMTQKEADQLRARAKKKKKSLLNKGK
jgi:hypothetical protein